MRYKDSSGKELVTKTTSRKKDKKCRKAGRNKKKCDRYRFEGRREKNKKRKADKRTRKLSR